MNAKKAFLLSTLSGLLFVLAWPVNGQAILIFGAFIPLLFLEDAFAITPNKHAKWKLFGWTYFSFLIWNVGVSWWLVNASLFGMLFANLCNSLFFTLLIQLFHWAKKRMPLRSAYLFLIVSWLAFEKFHLSWDFSWPWLNLGHVFSEHIYWIQWYEYTGAFGGSLWVLFLNIVLFEKIKAWDKQQGILMLLRKFVPVLVGIALPIAYSLFLFQKEIPETGSTQVLLTQPNIDPYDEKYQFSNQDFLHQLAALIQDVESEDYDYILTPETYFAAGYGERLDGFERAPFYRDLIAFQKKKPNAQLLTGIQFFDAYESEKAPTPTANRARKNLWVDYYNSALAISVNAPPQVYHKSKLVVGVENMPYKSFFEPLLGTFLLDLGGTVSSRATQDYRSVFQHPQTKTTTAPIICYESIYGEFVTEYVQKGAQFLSIITNDAWWGNTPGHKQLLSLARLRAIENRRAIARSANTGVSTFISAKGELLKQLPYGQKGTLLSTVPLYSIKTFYSQYGDYLARWAGFLTVLYFFIALSGRLKEKV